MSRVPVIVASENGRRGAIAAMELLRNGGSALDAVELAGRIVEDDPEEHSVGYSGLPNVLGQVELDASIMDGRTLQVGAVAAVHGYGNPITLARRVMTETPHVLIVARGAERLAAELDFHPSNQLSEEALRRWRGRYEEYGIDPHTSDALRTVAARLTRPVNLRDMVDKPGKDDTQGTVNFIAVDTAGNMASAVTTSGLAWKYPSRVGDSPIIGAGNYCDNRYGGAACTGMGELAIRVSTARSLVLYMKMGMSLHEAGQEILRELADLNPPEGQYMNIVALRPDGEHAGFTTVPGKQYLYFTGEMDEPALALRTQLDGE
jgi:beta-aspartyl-peptidase (threonine type)